MKNAFNRLLLIIATIQIKMPMNKKIKPKAFRYLFNVNKPLGNDDQGYMLYKYSKRKSHLVDELVDLIDEDYSFNDRNKVRKIISNELEFFHIN